MRKSALAIKNYRLFLLLIILRTLPQSIATTTTTTTTTIIIIIIIIIIMLYIPLYFYSDSLSSSILCWIGSSGASKLPELISILSRIFSKVSRNISPNSSAISSILAFRSNISWSFIWIIAFFSFNIFSCLLSDSASWSVRCWTVSSNLLIYKFFRIIKCKIVSINYCRKHQPTN